MKKIALMILLSLVLLFTISCTKNNESLENMNFNETCGNVYQVESSDLNEETQEFKTITPEEAKEILEENPNAVLLDVRTQTEYDKEHIPNAILFPNENITEETFSELGLDYDTTILVYCRTGIRSKEAASKIASLGYKNVLDIGGIEDWPYDKE